ncbi:MULTISPECIES: glycosyltransferase family 2 protein [unclassified Acinetobacter]|uniref:glycosyltransferase family 2 protein n=1 Tax=unclassified Acinetobacter TaxID=196816 RepID=UPI0029342995|nr:MULTISPECIES: glycosyltransferase [unclassified Acinetobacter]WOE31278.1 glycosyltransferase [Acinetobacter sp. SAAs470]WOE39474.1 glycosyltransferase [Acinetobacter sp. SAAs474]
MTILSIIIPVYNVEKYITECLISISNQIFNQEVEIILINDGSTDTSLQLIEKFLSNLPEKKRIAFNIVNTKNQGVSEARNTGIQIAKGEYITFIDSDDFILENYLTSILLAIESKPDIIQFNAYCYFSENPEKNYHLYHDSKLKLIQGNNTFNKELKYLIFNQNDWFSWLRVYHKDLFNDIKFPSNLSHFEDAFIICDIMNRAKTIFLIPDYLYNYRIINNSTTRNISYIIKDKLLNSCELIILKLINSCKYNKIYGIPLIHFFNIYIEESLKYKGKKIAQLNYNKFSNLIYNEKIPPELIKNKKERYILSFLKLGFFGYFLAKKLSKII